MISQSAPVLCSYHPARSSLALDVDQNTGPCESRSRVDNHSCADCLVSSWSASPSIGVHRVMRVDRNLVLRAYQGFPEAGTNLRRNPLRVQTHRDTCRYFRGNRTCTISPLPWRRCVIASRSPASPLASQYLGVGAGKKLGRTVTVDGGRWIT